MGFKGLCQACNRFNSVGSFGILDPFPFYCAPACMFLFHIADKRNIFLDCQVDDVIDIILKLVELGSFNRADLFCKLRKILFLEVL